MTYNGNNSFVRETVKGLNYVKKGDVNNIISDLSETDKVLSIKETEIGRDMYNPYNNTVYYNPQSGLETKDDNDALTSQIQSSALGLLHEIGHGFIDFFFSNKEKRYLEKKDRDYTNEEEKFVIDNIETRAAEILGEPSRTNHDGRPIKAKDSISRELEDK